MPELELITLFVRPLERAKINYMISGSLASMHYGEPRLTLDVDLVVHMAESDLNDLADAFPESDYYLPPRDVLAVELRRPSRGHFNIIHHETGMKADCYPSRSHPYWDWAWEHRRSTIAATEDSAPLSFAPPEYVILWKLEFYREGGGDKHLRDIRSMLAVSAEDIDRAWLEKAASDLGLSAYWQKVSAR